MFNKIILVGNLTREIELRYSQGGMGIAKSAIATSRKFTVNSEKREETCFVDITFFGRSAEVTNQYLRKGSKILVEGRLNFEQWIDQNGQKRSKHSVVVETMQMLDSKSDSGYAPTRDDTTQDMRQNPHPNHNSSRYDEPQPHSQSRGYDNQPYVEPQPSYEDKSGVSVSQESYQAHQNAQSPQQEMPDAT